MMVDIHRILKEKGKERYVSLEELSKDLNYDIYNDKQLLEEMKSNAFIKFDDSNGEELFRFNV